MLKFFLNKSTSDKQNISPFTTSHSKNIILVGADPDIIRTICLCLEAGFSVNGIYYFPWDPMSGRQFKKLDLQNYFASTENPTPKGLKIPEIINILSEKDIIKASKDEDVVFLVGGYGVREKNYFFKSLQYMRNKLRIQSPIYHPIFLADFLSFRVNNWICAGFQGSGNIIVQNVLNKLKSKSHTYPVESKYEAIQCYANNYFSTILSYLESQFYDLGHYESGDSQTNYSTGFIQLFVKNYYSPLFISNIPTFNLYRLDGIVGSHELVSQINFDKYKSRNMPVFMPIRNPLDVIVSCAAKITAYCGKRAPEALIDNKIWFEDILSRVVEYHRNALRKLECGAHLIFYEKLFYSPKPYLFKLCDKLDLPIDEQEIETIASTYFKATLSADPGHYWKPGEGKWIEYIPVEYKEIITSSELLDNAVKLGYNLDLGLLTRNRNSHHDLDPNMLADIYNEDFRWKITTDKPVSFDIEEKLTVKEKLATLIGPKEFADQFNQLDNSTFFEDLINSAGIVR